MVRGAVLFAVAVLALARGAATSAVAPPQLTVIGDSVSSTATTRYPDVQAVVDGGLRDSLGASATTVIAAR